MRALVENVLRFLEPQIRQNLIEEINSVNSKCTCISHTRGCTRTNICSRCLKLSAKDSCGYSIWKCVKCLSSFCQKCDDFEIYCASSNDHSELLNYYKGAVPICPDCVSEDRNKLTDDYPYPDYHCLSCMLLSVEYGVIRYYCTRSKVFFKDAFEYGDNVCDYHHPDDSECNILDVNVHTLIDYYQKYDVFWANLLTQAHSKRLSQDVT